MKRTTFRGCVLVVCVLAAGTVALGQTTVQLGAVHRDDAYQRWRDIATNPYDAQKAKTYVYEEAAVSITYNTGDHTFKGTITAANLKPNFAYEIKLNGKPTVFWEDGDDWANEQLGYNGRWWVDRFDRETGVWLGGRNSTDAEYEYWRDLDFKDESSIYVFQGYLLFDYMVTDASGTATKPFALDSSFHVLYKTTQRAPAPGDSVPTKHTVVALASSEWYSRDYRNPKPVEIYGQREPGRAPAGQVRLPIGAYNVRLFLTEESFHESAPDSGSWATVMSHDGIIFNVVAAPPPLVVTLESVLAADARTGGRYDITAKLRTNVAAKVTLDCKVVGGKEQVLERTTLDVPAGESVSVTWTDPVARSMKPGTYQATVTAVDTGASMSSNSFTVAK